MFWYPANDDDEMHLMPPTLVTVIYSDLVALNMGG